MSNNINLDYAQRASKETNKFYSKSLSIAVYVVSFSIPVLSVLLWYLIEKEHINLSSLGVKKNFNLADFLIFGFILGYFFFFILATVDIVKKMRRKIEIDTFLQKNALDLDLISKMKGLFWVAGIFSVLAIIMLSIGFASSNLGILVFKPYERKVAPPGVGPGIAEAHQFDFS